MGKTIDKVFKFIEENKDILSTIGTMIPSTQGSVQEPLLLPVDPVSASIKELSSPENVSGSIDSLSFFIKMKNIFIVMLILWAISVIVLRFNMTDETKKKDMEYVQTTLFGNIGIIPIILTTWIVSVILVSVIPLIIDTVPKLVGGVNSSLTDLIKLIPVLIK